MIHHSTYMQNIVELVSLSTCSSLYFFGMVSIILKKNLCFVFVFGFGFCSIVIG